MTNFSLYDISWAGAQHMPCLELANSFRPWPNQHNKKARDFVRPCTHHLSHASQSPTRDGSRGTPAVELTITHKSHVLYDIKLAEAVWALPEIRCFGPQRLVVLYQSPLPKVENQNKHTLDTCMHPIEAEPGDPSVSGVFIRSLNEEAYAKHVKGLEWY